MHDQVESVTVARAGSIAALQKAVVDCHKCPRLVRWREKVAREKVKRFAHDDYWGKPIPGFGDPSAHLLLVGLAPAAHGGNRTGRMFTGDESGRWLFRALYKAGFASQPDSIDRSDGLTLTDCYITATLRCAPPKNKPAPMEILRCRPFLLHEIRLLHNVCVVVGLGRIGFDAALDAFRSLGKVAYSRRPVFRHGASYRLGDMTFIASFHPSQQNTFTGRLTERMLDAVFRKARRLL
jgi:uracil-DNA glycosylase family 4